MNTMEAFARCEASRNKPKMVFDWDKAARIMREQNAKNAVAGLSGDLGATAGTILENGKPKLNEYTYLASTWATPVLILDDRDEEIDCYIMEEKTKWDAGTSWPKSAREIFKGINEV